MSKIRGSVQTLAQPKRFDGSRRAYYSQDTPKAFHRPVINAASHSGHALLHSCGLQFRVENAACILIPPVRMKQWMCFRMGGHGSIKCIENESVIVAITNGIGNNASIIQVQDGAQIYFVDFRTNVVFKLRHVRQPFRVWRVCVELTFQIVLGYVCRRCCVPSASVPFVFNG